MRFAQQVQCSQSRLEFAAAKNAILKIVQQVRTRSVEWELVETARVKGVDSEHISEFPAYRGTSAALPTFKAKHESLGRLHVGGQRV